jgi:SET domain-containing protein
MAWSIQKHIKYNYSFELTRNIILDSHAIGNESRYLNHSDDPNCEAKGKTNYLFDMEIH